MDSRDEQLHVLIAERAAEWHVACSEGKLSPQQVRDFMHWLRASPVHVAEFLAVSRIATDVSEAARDNSASLQELLAGAGELAQLPTALTERATQLKGVFPPYQPGHARRASRPRRAHARPAVRWAAAIATVATLFIAVLAGLHWVVPEPSFETFATRNGEMRSLTLPDSTFVQLGPDSTIKVRFDDRSRTVVVDRGQAHFKVVKHTGPPFRVRVGRSLIRDIGTEFDVYRQAAQTTVTVTAGRVQVWNLASATAGVRELLPFVFDRPLRGEPVISLGAGQEVTLENSGQVTRRGDVDASQASAWRRGRVAFDHRSIALVAAEFNRYNTVQISVDNADIAATVISGDLVAHDVQAFVAFLRGLPNVTVQQRGKRIVVGAKPRDFPPGR